MAQKSAEKWKNKKWFNVYSPKLFGENVIGEIPADDEKLVGGRMIKVNLSWLTNKPEHSFFVVGLRVTKASGSSANTELGFLEETYGYVHSLVRRHTSVVYITKQLKDREGKEFVLKAMVVTRNKIATTKKTAMRKALDDFFAEYASKVTLEEFIKAALDNSFQADGVNAIKNIAQISKFEARKIVV
jgi:ribosomal protein S3AE